MPRRVSGKRYAQALFELALSHNQLDQWGDDLGLVSEALEHEEFRLFLSHPDVLPAEKTRALDEVLQGVDPLVKNLVALLVTRGLLRLFQDVRLSFGRLLDEHLGRQPVEVISAVTLSKQELERITRFVSELIQKEVVVSSEVDESILGGLIIQIGDRLLDGSTRSRLEQLRKQIRAHVVTLDV